MFKDYLILLHRHPSHMSFLIYNVHKTLQLKKKQKKTMFLYSYCFVILKAINQNLSRRSQTI